ncbi:uncharacterized protein LOC134848711 [Symsagittifera roscoffensis]|uniref:uncharacterized protein LOC134848711 n=1 Tax=Symsagittifera roscoffensis TaxID=84072 RepID=UPI00307BC78C
MVKSYSKPKRSRKTAVAVCKGFESDCSIEFVYFSSEDEDTHHARVDDFSTGSRGDGRSNSRDPEGRKKKPKTKRRSLFNDDAIDAPVSRNDQLRSSKYTEDHLDRLLGGDLNGHGDNTHQNGIRESQEREAELLDKNSQLEGRVSELEEEVDRLNAEVIRLKGIVRDKDMAAEIEREKWKEEIKHSKDTNTTAGQRRENRKQTRGQNRGTNSNGQNGQYGEVERRARSLGCKCRAYKCVACDYYLFHHSRPKSPGKRGTTSKSCPADKRRPPPGNSQRVHKTSLGLPNGSMTTSPLEDRDRVGHRGDDMPDIFQRLSSGVGSSAMRRGRSMDSLNGSLPNKDKKFGKNNLKN